MKTTEREEDERRSKIKKRINTSTEEGQRRKTNKDGRRQGWKKDKDERTRTEDEEEQGVENSSTHAQEYYILQDLNEELKLERNRLSEGHAARIRDYFLKHLGIKDIGVVVISQSLSVLRQELVLREFEVVQQD